mmetsp:Transcript_29780/g.28949  ORF Transcript_29780/g.28949 Transcript_29780/m.28949 type:complete len:134 (+) Transcript_29780:179-580(+)|eukprot:CAMPEP_0170550322 /NCGR_PEP_ID=MMETSP0211-20121228/8379_1 /TAXON_ID=311385 /ORGANISM="Pseudokeronopsis sp., Strain OXSARD2" /LENGTH=133 /DNA_ID=CAMNT_0010856799 /DNA_START=1007 /DNA_END=1408 /DNA_ORIENTATION=+
MYKQGKYDRATNLLPGLGEPVKTIDISRDEQWVVATCPEYLLVFGTQMKNGKTGFETNMRNQKPELMKLTLSSKDIAKYKIKKIDFTPARFNSGDQTQEESIVTSTGPFLITWNFLKVKKGALQTYKLTRLQE